MTRSAQTTVAPGYGQMLARLESLRNKAGESTFERVGIAVSLLRDTGWLETFNGDQHAAQESLESDYFGDMCGAVTLSEWLVLHREFPAKADWQRHKWNVKLMWAEHLKRARDAAAQEREARGEEPKEPRTRRAVKIEEHEAEIGKRKEEEAKNTRLSEEKAQLVTVLKTKDQVTDGLRQENAELKLKIAKLEGRIMELERQMSLRSAS